MVTEFDNFEVLQEKMLYLNFLEIKNLWTLKITQMVSSTFQIYCFLSRIFNHKNE